MNNLVKNFDNSQSFSLREKLLDMHQALPNLLLRRLAVLVSAVLRSDRVLMLIDGFDFISEFFCRDGEVEVVDEAFRVIFL